MNEDRCVCCGEYVPEGRMVCQKCYDRYWMIDQYKNNPIDFLQDFLIQKPNNVSMLKLSLMSLFCKLARIPSKSRTYMRSFFNKVFGL